MYNSCLGQVMQRQQLVKEDGRSTWHWRDLNLGMNIFVHGRVYRVINCDQFTRNWYETKGKSRKFFLIMIQKNSLENLLALYNIL